MSRTHTLTREGGAETCHNDKNDDKSLINLRIPSQKFLFLPLLFLLHIRLYVMRGKESAKMISPGAVFSFLSRSGYPGENNKNR